MPRVVPNPAPDGYLRIAYASRGPIWSKWVGEGPEPKAAKPKKAK